MPPTMAIMLGAEMGGPIGRLYDAIFHPPGFRATPRAWKYSPSKPFATYSAAVIGNAVLLLCGDRLAAFPDSPLSTHCCREI